MSEVAWKSWSKQADLRIASSDADFHAWFDAAADDHELVANGAIDFYHRIYQAGAHDLVGDPRKESCLEIGCGGGRLLLHASSVFGHAYGIDILSPDAFARTERFMHEHARDNFTLLHRDEMHGKVPTRSVRFAYSFIVFQHLSSPDEVSFYLAELDRVLDARGIAMLFFGLAPADCPGGCMSNVSLLNDNPRACTLAMTPEFMSGLVGRTGGLRVMTHGHAGRKKLWDESMGLSSQHCMLIGRKERV